MSSRPFLIAGLVPAAGSSRRLGQDKRLLPFRGATLLETTVGVLQRGGLSPIVVVLEPTSPCRRLPGLAGTMLVENPDPARGMLSSIREGLRAMPGEIAGVAVLPGDHALVPVEAVAALVSRFRDPAGAPTLLVPSYGGERGHPLLMHRDLFDEAARCDDDVGLRQLLDRRASEVELVELPASRAEQDLDRPEDLALLRRLEEEFADYRGASAGREHGEFALHRGASGGREQGELP